MRTIAVINQKGGVGKTTTVANLSAGLAARSFNVAAIDLDPQAHLTMHFGVEPGAPATSVYEVLTEGAGIAAASICVQPHLWLVPSSIDLAGAEIELVTAVGREQLLADRLAEEALPYDYVLLDCPPSLGLLTLNALAAADEVIIPLQPHFLALQGLGKLLETVALVQRRINPKLRVSGVLMCMYETATRLAGEVLEDVEAFLNARNDPTSPWARAKVFEARIRRNIKLAECPSFGKTIFEYEPYSHGAHDYDELADEFLALHAPPTPQEPPAASVTVEPSSEPEPAPAAVAPTPDAPSEPEQTPAAPAATAEVPPGTERPPAPEGAAT